MSQLLQKARDFPISHTLIHMLRHILPFASSIKQNNQPIILKFPSLFILQFSNLQKNVGYRNHPRRCRAVGLAPPAQRRCRQGWDSSVSRENKAVFRFTTPRSASRSVWTSRSSLPRKSRYSLKFVLVPGFNTTKNSQVKVSGQELLIHCRHELRNDVHGTVAR